MRCAFSWTSHLQQGLQSVTTSRAALDAYLKHAPQMLKGVSMLIPDPASIRNPTSIQDPKNCWSNSRILSLGFYLDKYGILGGLFSHPSKDLLRWCSATCQIYLYPFLCNVALDNALLSGVCG